MNGQAEQTATLPTNREEIIHRLRTVNDDGDMVARLYPGIASYAGQELLPQGIVLMLELAAQDYGQQYPPPMGAIVRLFIPRWIDALIDDKEVAEAAKQFLNEIEEKVKEDRKANTPTRVEPEGPIEDYDLYIAVRKVSDIFFEEVHTAQEAGADLHVSFCNDGANPFYSQTASGLFVEYYYGHPSKVWTPWGYWHFVSHVGYSGNPWPSILERVLERLGATEYIAERSEEWGVYGPVYALSKVDDIELPEPTVRERQNYLEYSVANQAWKNMTQRYNTEHSTTVEPKDE